MSFLRMPRGTEPRFASTSPARSRASKARAARVLRSDVSALSEIALILILVIVIILAVGFVAGGFTLVIALFFGGRLGAALFLFVLAGLALLVGYFVKPMAKLAMYGAILFVVLALIFLVLGVLGR